MFFQVLLGSDLIKSSLEECSLLKNLGSWLGKITIGRSQVLRAREIDPKFCFGLILIKFLPILIWKVHISVSLITITDFVVFV